MRVKKDPSGRVKGKKPGCGGFPTAMNRSSAMRGAVGWGHPERVEANDMGSNERSPEAYEAKGRAVDIK